MTMAYVPDRAAIAALQKARKTFAAGDVLAAALACKAICVRDPDFAEGWHLASAVAVRMGRLDKALECIEHALSLAPDEPILRMHFARILLMSRQSLQAQQIVDEIEGAYPQSVMLLSELAGFYSLANVFEKALPYYRRLATTESVNPRHWFNLASTERFCGNIDAAEKAYQVGLRLDPQIYEAYYLRAGLRRQTPEHNHVGELERLRASISVWQGLWVVCYALAKEYEDLGEYERSFDALKQGADLRRKHMQYRVEDDLRAIDAIITAYPCHSFSKKPQLGQQESREPIFVLGLPRSGTTLVERILGSHRDVFAAGELGNFAVEMSRAIQVVTGKGALPKLDAIAASTRIDFAELGRAYLDSTRPRTGHTPRFVDKMPLNFLYIGLISRALPGATIIELVRHPLDVCYAIYKQMFTRAYPFSYDLLDLARYFCAYRRLMRHWHACMPDRILRVRYEDLVRDQASQTRWLLEGCGLAWDDSCLSYERNANATTTASAVQVREKIYCTSMDKWRNYEQQLQPLIQYLRTDPEGQMALEEYSDRR